MMKRPSLSRTQFRFLLTSRIGSALPDAAPRPRTADGMRHLRPNIITLADQGALGDGRHPTKRQPLSTVAGCLSPLSP